MMQKYSQHIAEALIPLLGFYFWNWNWYFILLFYVLDGLAREIVLHLKSKKIFATQGGNSARDVWVKFGVKSAVMALVVAFVLHFMYFINHPQVDFGQEFTLFLSYTEMGIAQGWVLLPLIALNVWTQYKFTFLKLGLHTKISLSQLWKAHLNQRSFYLSTVIIGLGIHVVFHLNDVFFLWASVLLPVLYVRFIMPKL